MREFLGLALRQKKRVHLLAIARIKQPYSVDVFFKGEERMKAIILAGGLEVA